jgi:enamine deaminase RidA (YjgF/YER057c/UK114 family)
MTSLEFSDPPGFRETMGTTFHYSQAVKVGNRIEISGQGGWTDTTGRTFPDDVAAEVAVAFDNVEHVLNAAGSSWKDVVSLTSYHVPSGPNGSIDPGVLEQIVGELKRRAPSRRPIWTAVATGLASPDMNIEIAVTAVVAE